ncbi:MULTISPECIES: AI-2E family transporter YdiK [unclassified Gilliamella]|uniref:AI-2E family transporter YdiK n=1 Tax=unclassified Gilliamella TaxID=2685620 RepID=UPI002269B2ED|nr:MULTISPECIES: AI-2E family transporter YdiK [unclassified Gilliamella]MCX8641836.1 AI-2E family transporter YdiK [Gilliamella sp. B3835]MCX8706636.1 AI-2E family transporter YdiK [Gilliamella sp. B3783]MCX8708895.1 AI-2E family transporter YdiK [Gilliamella sp. B3780]MCX8713112.1 AI-2E family transporter YdiK [Gilliamella sp. B3468]MCX8713679.1 AI-2E family transporter YdiK [Gilliamella sp. B3781]
MPAENNTYDLLKLILNLLIIGLLIIITYRVVEPFLFGFFWAVMVVIATWPLMIKIQQKLFNKRWLSLLVMALILAFVCIIPFILIISSVAQNGHYLIEWARTLPHRELPTLDWLSSLPMFGNELHQKWLEIIQTDGSELISDIQPYIGILVGWLLEQATNISIFIFHAGVMIIFSLLLFLKGESITKYVYVFANRLSKHYGKTTVTLAGQAIRAVALGVVVTAITLALIGGISFVLTNMPFPGILTLILFICCVAQIGPVIVMIGCIIWQFWDGNTISAIVLIFVAIILTTLDSVMRAYLIKKGADLPFLLILFGVIGGILAFGIMGLFIGPVVLALTYKLIESWVDEQA